MSDVNWNVELRKLEREFGGLPPEPTAAEQNARRAAERRARELQDAINARIGAAVRSVLVAALGAALYFWPYDRACGLGLSAYLAAAVVFTVGALWVFAYSWRHRLAKTHGAALLMLLAGIALVAAQALPRLPAPWIDAAYRHEWSCR